MEDSRFAESADIVAVVDLARRLVEELTSTRGGDLWSKREAPKGDLFRHYTSVLERQDSTLIVGTIDHAIVGYASLGLETLADGSLLGVIHELYVDIEARSVGVGESLAVRCLQWCEDRHCRGVDARALPGNRAAKNFFEINGFVARSITMHRVIEQTA